MPSPRALIVFVLLLVMEVLGAYAILVGSGLTGILRGGDAVLWLLLLGGLGGLATGLGVALLGPAEPWNRILLLVGGALFALVPAALVGRDLAGAGLALLLLAVAYWRGLRISLEPADPESVKREFGFGFGLLFLGILWGISRDVNHTRPFWSLLAVTGVAFTIVAMIALVVARLERQREPGSGLAVFIAVAVQIGVLLLLAVGALLLFGHDLAGAVGDATRPVRDVLGAAGYHVIALLAGPIQWLLDLVRNRAHTVTPPLPRPPTRVARQNRKKPHIGHADQTPLIVLGAIALTVLVCVVAYIVWRMLPRIQRYRAPKGYEEERRTLMTPAEILRMVLGWLLAMLRKSGTSMAQVVQRTRRRIWGEYPEDPVRRVYVQLLRRAAAAGQPRSPDATPDEFGRRVAARWPDVAFDLGAITEAYVVRRYGEIAPDGAAVERLGDHWQRVRSAIRVPRTGAGGLPRANPAPEKAETGEPTPPLPWRERIRQRLASLNDPGGSIWGSVIVWIACAVIPIVLALLLVLVLLLARL